MGRSFELPLSGQICSSQLQKCWRKRFVICIFICFFVFYFFSVLFFKLWLISCFKLNVSVGEKLSSKSQNFGTWKFKLPDITHNILLILFKVNFQNFDMLYLLTERFPTNFLKRYPRQYLARLLLQSTFKYQEYQKIIFNLLSFTFNVICFSETWFDGLTLSENTSYELLNYQAQGNRKGGGVSIYVHISLNFKIRSNLSISINDIESLFTEIIFDKIRNAIGNVLYSSAVV